MRKSNILLTLIITAFFVLNINAQHPKLDSIIESANKVPEGFKKLIIYNTIQGNCKFEDILKYSYKTIALSEKILKKYPQKKDSILYYKSVAFNDIGYYYKENGKTSKAIDFFLLAIKIQESINDNALPIGYHNIAIILREQGDTIKAINYLYKAESICKRNKNFELNVHIQNQIGLTYKEKGDYAKALHYYESSLKIAQSIKDLKLIAKSLVFIGTVYNIQQKYSEAKKYFEEALNIYDKTGDFEAESSPNLFLATIYQNQKNYLQAEKHYFLALKQSSQAHSLNNRKSSLKGLGELYNLMKIYNKAYLYLYNYTTLKDSLQNDKTKKEVLTKELQYNFDKKFTSDSVKNVESQKVKDAIIRANKSELSQEKTKRYTLYAGIFLLLSFGGFIYNRFKLSQKQKQIIELKNKETEQQKHVIEEKQKEIVDSINYAKRIQYALLAHDDILKRNLHEYFVFFKPKDIVSGDFYWATEHDEKFYIATCDSTGHGVPGAFMSLLNIGFLSEAIKEKSIVNPHEVLNYVRKRLIESIGGEDQKDGMDAVILCIDKKNNSISYAAANNAPIIIRGTELIELPKDKMPVGKGEKTQSFTLQFMDLKKGDVIYIYTDGFADQFGGPKDKKFMYKKLNHLLSEIASLPLNEQSDILEKKFDEWKGNLDQVDDVLVLGIKL